MGLDAISSWAFVAVAVGILVTRPRRVVFALLVAAVGVGSYVQHGPHPSWQAYAHDLPLAAVLAYVATDAASHLAGRELSPAWWIVPTIGLAPVVAIGHGASTAYQVILAIAAIGLSLVRALLRPALRPRLVTALGLLALGALAGTASHAIWHVLSAASLYVLAGVVSVRGRGRRRGG